MNAKLKKKLVAIATTTCFMLTLITPAAFAAPDPLLVDKLSEQSVQEAKMLETFEAGNYTLENPYIVVNPYDIAPLSAYVMFETEEETWADIYVHASVDSKYEEYCSIKYDFDEDLGKTHVLPIYGLYDGTTVVTVTLHDADGKTVASKDLSIEATLENIENPENVPSISGLNLYRENGDYSDYFVVGETQIKDGVATIVPVELSDEKIEKMALYEPYSGAMTYLAFTKNIQVAVDLDGQPRMVITPNVTFPTAVRVDLYDSVEAADLKVQATGHGTNHFLAGYAYAAGMGKCTGIIEFDPMGKIYKHWSGEKQHHDFAYNPITDAMILDPGIPNNQYLQEVDYETGKVLRDWDLTEAFDFVEQPTGNWLHINALAMYRNPETLEIEDAALLSCFNQDGIFKLNLATNEVEWFITTPDMAATGIYTDEFAAKGLIPVMEVDGVDVLVEKWWAEVSGNTDIDWNNLNDPYYLESSKYTENGEVPFMFPDTHAVNSSSYGSIYVFDNGTGNKNSTNETVGNPDNAGIQPSRAVEYWVDEDAHTVKQIWSYGYYGVNEQSDKENLNWYSGYISDVDYLGEGHWMIDFGGIGGTVAGGAGGAACANIVEVLDDEEIFALRVDTNIFRSERVTLYNDDKEVKLGEVEGKVLGDSMNGRPYLTAIDLPEAATVAPNVTVTLTPEVTTNCTEKASAKTFIGANFVESETFPTLNVVWNSSNPEVATVDANGVVKALKAGTTVISATVVGGYNTPVDSCTLTVAEQECLLDDNVKMEVAVGENTIVINGQTYLLDASAFIEDGRTYVPLRAVMEALGADVTWNDNTDTVTITTK